MNKQLSDDVFFEKYSLMDNPFIDDAPYENKMFETYGPEHEVVIIAATKTPNRVWTIIDNNNGWFGIVAGYHWVNRQGYFITNEDCESDDEEYTIYDTTGMQEEWESLSDEALREVTGQDMIPVDDDELEDFRNIHFYMWEELGEDQRKNIVKKYKTK